jgi:hypothetical protein
MVWPAKSSCVNWAGVCSKEMGLFLYLKIFLPLEGFFIFFLPYIAMNIMRHGG